MATPDQTDSTDNVTEYTVSELSGALKRTVEQRFGYVRVRAELSGVKIAASGHIYMALKDDKAVMDGVMWRGTTSRLQFRPEDGLEVICSGKLTTYPARSKYQMVIERMEIAGEGALMALLEKRKKALAAEGLFDPAGKKPIPFLPRTIAVVTSPTGAVIRDILHRLSDRFPSHVLVWPVLVQGEGAKDQVAAAIRGFNQIPAGGDLPRPDVLIVARGGGSIEDLWAFNEEEVVRAAAASDIPLISAVGHETDHSLLDLAADLRAPTPTAAAEMAVPVREELQAGIADLGRRLSASKQRLLDQRRDQVRALARALPSPRDLLGLASQRLDDISQRLPGALARTCTVKEAALSRVSGKLTVGPLNQRIQFGSSQLAQVSGRLRPALVRQIDERTSALAVSGRMLESLSHKSVLSRGFALVTGVDGKPVTSAGSAATGDVLGVAFHDGQLSVTVGEGGGSPAAAPKQKTVLKKRKKKADDGSQGSLF